MKSAIEWLSENYLPIGEQHSWKSIEILHDPIPTMERFANYRTKELQAKILLFSQWIIEKWNESETGYINGAYLLEAFKKHFEITEARDGTL